MKLTTKSEYSLLSLIFIARNQNKHFIKIDDICSYYEIPKKYLEQLLIILKQNRYIKAKRGAGGGYRLNKQPNEISIAEIVRLMDGALAPTESVSTYFYSTTPLSKEKNILTIFKKIRDFIADTLENTTLKDLL
jgi:Rrf2 family protein